MKIPIMDLKEQYGGIKAEIDGAIKKVIDAQSFILGEEVKGLEENMARYCGAAHAVGVASGTDALILALKAFGIKAGDEVITTPFTFIATAEAISIVGAKPVFVDIDPKTYNIDPLQIEKKITLSTKAIIPVHLYGQCADMDPIMAIARDHNLKVIEDAAQAIGATYKKRKAGSIGDIGALSFFPSKNLGGFGDGGMIVTNDKDLADKIRVMRVHGSSVRYIHSVIGMNSRLDNIQAAALGVKLKYLDKWLEARRRNAGYYNEKLRTPAVTVPYTGVHNVHTYHLYVLRVASGSAGLTKALVENGIEARAYYPVPLHLQDCYRSLSYRKGDLKNAEAAALETCAIPLYPEIKKEAMDYVIDKIKACAA